MKATITPQERSTNVYKYRKEDHFYSQISVIDAADPERACKALAAADMKVKP